MSFKRVALGFAALTLAFAIVSTIGGMARPAAATETGGGHLTPRQLRQTIGAGYTEGHDGTYRIALPGRQALATHGPDTGSELAQEGGSPDPQGARRAPACASDHPTQFLYLHRPGTPSGFAGDYAHLQQVIQAADATLNRESLASGGPTADYKVACDASGAPRIEELTTSATSFGDVALAALLAGFGTLGSRYAIFADDAVPYCGMGSLFPDDSRSALNLSVVSPGYAVIARRCWDGSTLMHELGHTQGAVQASAPHSTGSGGHCNQEIDVMCYSPDGGDRNQGGSTTDCSDYERFDCGYDDYFDTAPEPGEYLSSHWNLGSPLNQAIALGRNQWETTGPSALVRGPVSNPDLTTGPATFHPYSFKVPRRSRGLRVTLTPFPCAPSCQFTAQLFLKRGSAPTVSKFTCRAALGAAQQCTVRKPKPGRWFAGVYSTGPIGAPYSISLNWRKG
jgi:hypothetical protein